MHQRTYVKVAILSAFCVCGAVFSAHAQWPTFDGMSVNTQISEQMQVVQNTKTKIESCKQVTKAKSLLGDVQKAASGFAADKIKAAKALAEKAKKAAEKAKKIKEDIDKAKAKYEAKKAELEEYKKKVEAAKQKVNDAKNKIDEAKNKVNEVKSKVDEAKNKVNEVKSKVDEAKSKVDEAKNKINDVKSKVDDAKAMAKEAQSVASGAAGLASQTLSTAQGAVASKVDAVGLKASSAVAEPARLEKESLRNTVENASPAVMVNSPTTVSSPVLSSAPVSVQQSGASSVISAAPIASEKANLKSEARALKASSNAAMPVSAAPSIGRTAFTTASGLNSATESLSAEPLSAEQMPLPSTELTAQPVGDEEVLDEEEESDKAKEKLDRIKAKSAVDGSLPAVNVLEGTLSQAVRTKDEKTLEAISKLDVADVVNSDSKKYEDTSAPAATVGRKAFTLAPAAASSVDEDKKAAKAAAQATKANLEQDKTAVKEATKAAKANVQVPAGVDVKAVDKTAATVGVTAKDVKLLQSAPVKEATPAMVQPVSNSVVPTNRRAFETPATLGKSSFFLEDEKKTQSHSIKLSYNQRLGFGSAAGECTDYSNTLEFKDDNGSTTIILLPESLAKECCLKAEQLSDMNVIKDCAANLLKKMRPQIKSSDSEDENEENNEANDMLSQEAEGLYSTIISEQKINSLAEAMSDSNVAQNYVADRFQPFLEQIQKMHEENQKKVESSSDGTSGISIKDELSMVQLSNQEMIYLLNLLRREYTSMMVNSSLNGLENVTSGALDEEREIGLDDGAGNEYEASIIRNQINYPIIPENLAKKCNLKVSENVNELKNCFIEIVKGMHVSDNKEVEIAQAFIENLRYQDTLDVLGKAMYHKYLSAVQDKREEEIKSKSTGDQPDEKTAETILFETEKEMAVLIDEILTIYAGQLAYATLAGASALTPPSTSASTGTKG